jgi:hypothetical protein
MVKTEYLPPGIHGPSLRWYRPLGFAVLVLRSLLRFWITGRPVVGRGDNATFLRDATVDYRGGPVERLTRARWRRVAWRWAVLGGPWVLVDLWVLEGPLWGWALAGYLVIGLGTGGTAAWRWVAVWWPAREERRDLVYPTWQVVCRIIGERYSRRTAVKAVVITADPLSVRLHLPAVPLDEGAKKRIAVSAGERLGIPDVAAAWTVRGARAYVDLSPRAHPPTALVFAEVRLLWADASPARPLVGLAAGRKPVYADLDNDGPHLAMSAGTGAGKSTLLRVILARRVQAGVGLVVCDYKVISHRWARRIAQVDPGRVRYACDEEEISDAIMAVFGEFSRRREMLKTDPDALEDFREIDLLVEELNSLAAMLRKWWGHERRRILADAKDNGEATPYVPIVPPCVDALGVLVQAGRELRIHVHAAAQRLDASALGPKDGGAIRESFSNRFLAKYTKKAWIMLCDGVPYEAFPGGPRGIWTAVVNGEVTHFRVPFVSDDEAYALAMSGAAPTGGLLRGSAPAAREVERLVTLGEAWELIGAPSLAALQKAVQRAETPSVGRRGNALLYDVRALEGVLAKR